MSSWGKVHETKKRSDHYCLTIKMEAVIPGDLYFIYRIMFTVHYVPSVVMKVNTTGVEEFTMLYYA